MDGPGDAERGYLELARPDADYKAAESLAFTIGRDIIREGKQRHAFLGSETDLIGRYAVSRAVFREAMRILEYHSLVVTRRGPRGGIYVGDPDARAVTAATAMFLEFEHVEPRQLYDTRSALELHAVDLATKSLDAGGEDRLRRAAAGPTATDDPMGFIRENDFHRTVCELSGNKPLTLFVDVCRTLTSFHSVALDRDASPSPAADVAWEIASAHLRIAQLMIDRDPDGARDLMDRHLKVMLKWLR